MYYCCFLWPLCSIYTLIFSASYTPFQLVYFLWAVLLPLLTQSSTSSSKWSQQFSHWLLLSVSKCGEIWLCMIWDSVVCSVVLKEFSCTSGLSFYSVHREDGRNHNIFLNLHHAAAEYRPDHKDFFYFLVYQSLNSWESRCKLFDRF